MLYEVITKSFARRVHDTLQGRGIRCWLDENFGYLGPQEYVREPVIKICKDFVITSYSIHYTKLYDE